MRYALCSVLSLAAMLSGCAEPTTEPGLKAIIGGRLEAGSGAAPVAYSIIVIAKGQIRAMGAEAVVPVPKGAETISAKGKVIRPAGSTLVTGQPADLVLFDAQTGSREREMRAGEWVH